MENDVQVVSNEEGKVSGKDVLVVAGLAVIGAAVVGGAAVIATVRGAKKAWAWVGSKIKKPEPEEVKEDEAQA